MRAVFVSLVVVFFISCNDEDDFMREGKRNQIRKGVAEKMIKHVTDCTGDCYEQNTVFWVDTAYFQKLKAEHADADVTWVNARYRKGDEKRYRKARGLSDDDEKGKVRGRLTKLIRVAYHDAKMEALFFDGVSCLCPPPEGASRNQCRINCLADKDSTANE